MGARSRIIVLARVPVALQRPVAQASHATGTQSIPASETTRNGSLWECFGACDAPAVRRPCASHAPPCAGHAPVMRRGLLRGPWSAPAMRRHAPAMRRPCAGPCFESRGQRQPCAGHAPAMRRPCAGQAPAICRVRGAAWGPRAARRAAPGDFARHCVATRPRGTLVRRHTRTLPRGRARGQAGTLTGSQARTNAGTQACRHAGAQACSQAGRQARRHTGTQTCRRARTGHAGTQAARHAGTSNGGTQACGHTGTQAGSESF